MAVRYDVGTPLQGERKYRRMYSPLQEMDGVRGELDFEEDAIPKTPPGAGATPVTLEGIAALLDKKFDERLQPIKQAIANMHEDVDAIEGRMDANMSNISNDLTQLRQDTDTKVDNVLRRVEAMEIRVEEVRQSLRDARGMTTPDTGTPRSMQEGSASMATENGFTAVLGGFKGAANQDELERWVSRSLWSVGANMPTVLYIKGEFSHFNGVAFGKYTSKMERDAVVSTLQAAGLEYGGQKMWSKIELPQATRDPQLPLWCEKHVC